MNLYLVRAKELLNEWYVFLLNMSLLRITKRLRIDELDCDGVAVSREKTRLYRAIFPSTINTKHNFIKYFLYLKKWNYSLRFSSEFLNLSCFISVPIIGASVFPFLFPLLHFPLGSTSNLFARASPHNTPLLYSLPPAAQLVLRFGQSRRKIDVVFQSKSLQLKFTTLRKLSEVISIFCSRNILLYHLERILAIQKL